MLTFQSPMKFILSLLLLFAPPSYCAERIVLSLDGEWDITDSKTADRLPTHFDHKAPVPVLVHSSTPGFADVDLFDSQQVIQNRVAQGTLPQTALVRTAGVPRQDRNWFWYRRTFDIAVNRSVAVLRINNAQFGAAVWLKGKKDRGHLPRFWAAVVDVADGARRRRRN